MTFQLSWKTLPGLRGLACSEFQAVETRVPDSERGVVVDFPTELDCNTFVADLELHFAAQRFSNNAAAFESVKTYVLERMAQRGIV